MDACMFNPARLYFLGALSYLWSVFKAVGWNFKIIFLRAEEVDRWVGVLGRPTFWNLRIHFHWMSVDVVSSSYLPFLNFFSYYCLKTITVAWQLWRTPLIPAFGRQRQVDLCEFEASLVYRVSSRTDRVTQRNSVLKNKQAKKKKNYHFEILMNVHLIHSP